MGHLLSAWFWGRYARWYDDVWDGPVAAAVAERLRPHVRGVVIDHGSGTGLLGRRLGTTATTWVDADLSEAMVARDPAALRIVADASHAPFADGVADVVVLANLLHLAADPAAVLAEAVRLCRRSGTLAVVTPAERLTPRAVRRAERRAGRGRGSALRADLRRRAIQALAVGAGVRPRRGTAGLVLRSAVDGDWRVVEDDIVLGCQRVLVLELPA